MLTGSVSRGNGGQYFYYHCHNRCCGNYGKAIPKADLETAFAGHLKKITPKPRMLEVIKAAVINVWEGRTLAMRSEAERHATILANQKAKRARIQGLREDGTYSGEEGKERLAEIKSEIIATEIALSEARIEQLDVETAVTFATNFIGDLGRQWFDLPPDLRPRFQQLIFPEGVSYSRSKGFGTTKLGLIFELYRQTAGENPSLVDLMGVGWNQILAELREWQALRAVPTRISAA